MYLLLLVILQLSSTLIRVVLAEYVEESRVYFIREVAGLQAAALLVEGKPRALLFQMKRQVNMLPSWPSWPCEQ